MEPEDEDTCEEIEDYVCDKDMDKEDKDYCVCIGLVKKDGMLRGFLTGV
jgi:hypothetical protein